MGLVQSTSEARRAIQQGGVRLNGEVQSDPRFLLTPPPAPVLIQVGKKRAARLLPPEG
jgi:tyrosyl-tRNA synthetase